MGKSKRLEGKVPQVKKDLRQIGHKLVQEENTHPTGAITLADFNKVFNKMTGQGKSKKREKEVFVTYSWDSDEHKKAVLSFADFLRKKGFETDIDRKISQESTAPDFTKMMHQAMTDYAKVVVVLSDGYKTKADSFKGGVGTEYSLIINDINQNTNKYVLVSFQNISDEIIPLSFKGREVIDLTDNKNYDTLFAKLQNEPQIEFSSVASEKPKIAKTSITPFEEVMKKKKEASDEPTNPISNLSLSEMKTTFVGAHHQGNFYSYAEYDLNPVIKNNSNKTIEEFDVEVILPSKLTNYEAKGRIEADNKIFQLRIKERLYPGQTKEVECGNLRIEKEFADIAFANPIKVKIFSDLGVTEEVVEIQPLLKLSDLNYRPITLTYENFNY